MLKFVALALFGVAVCQANVLGGYSELDEDSSEAKQVLSFVESSLNAQSNDMFSSRVSDVFKVQRQTVNGFNYKIEFEFSRTGCSKYSMIALSTCPLNGRVEQCTAKVYRPFGGVPELQDFSCKPAKATRRMAGGVSGPVDNPESFRAEVVKALSQTSNGLLEAEKDFEIVEVRMQVVSGLKYYMKVKGQVNGKLNMCEFTIWSQPWMVGQEYKVSPQECEPIKAKKRSLLGGKSCAGCVGAEKEVSGDIQALFEDAMAESNDAKLMSAIDLSKTRYISVTEQVVTGIKYVLKLETESDEKKQLCSVTFVHVAWQTPSTSILDYTCQ